VSAVESRIAGVAILGAWPQPIAKGLRSRSRSLCTLVLNALAFSACDSEPKTTGSDSLVTWSGEELRDLPPPPPPRDTPAFMRVERLPLATDSQRVLATAERPPDDRRCRGDTLVWMWHEGLVVSLLDGYVVESHIGFPAGFEGTRHNHQPRAEGRCTAVGSGRSPWLPKRRSGYTEAVASTVG
jgi:hypothetical protein